MKGRYPVCCLFLEIDPAAVDVNIHPAKREVKFHRELEVRQLVAQAVRETLLKFHARQRSKRNPTLTQRRRRAENRVQSAENRTDSEFLHAGAAKISIATESNADPSSQPRASTTAANGLRSSSSKRRTTRIIPRPTIVNRQSPHRQSSPRHLTPPPFPC